MKRTAEDTVFFHGDPRITATHRATIEVTKDGAIHGKGDCIIGVRASKACADLDEAVKILLRGKNSRVTLKIQVGPHIFEASALGDPSLILSHPSDIVLRRSHYICARTAAIAANKVASDLPREMVSLLRSPSTQGTLKVLVEAEPKDLVRP
jgi:hypothetical protein